MLTSEARGPRGSPQQKAGEEGTGSLEVSGGTSLRATSSVALGEAGMGDGQPEVPLRSLKYMAFGDTGSQLT